MPAAPGKPSRRVGKTNARPEPPKDVGKISLWAWASLILCLVLTVVVLGLDGVSRFAMVEKVSHTSFSEAPPHTLPVAQGAREEWLVLPHYAMDARWWVLHTERLLREGSWRVRGTNLDNAPEGREVHWSSLLMWILAGLAWLHSLFSGAPPDASVAEAAMVAGPVMLAVSVVGLAVLAAVRFGKFAGAFWALVILTSFPLLRTFLTGEADHHGLVVAFAMGGVLCLLAGGCGFVRARNVEQASRLLVSGPGGSRDGRPTSRFPDTLGLPDLATARRWFAGAGILGAASLWVSAATAIPILAGVAAGGFLGFLVRVRGEKSGTVRPELWMIWGLAGGIASVGFYLLEYFPNHLGWRLEVNHPLYAFAWMGGAFLLSRTLSGIEARRFPLRSGLDFGLAILAFAALLAPLLAILWVPDAVFWVSDDFLLALHKEYILEFQNIFAINRITGGGISWLTQYTWPMAVLVCTVLLGLTRQFGPLARRALPLLAPALVITQILTVVQVRWASAAFGMWSLAALIVLADLALSPRPTGVRRWAFRGLISWGWVAILLTLLPQIGIRAKEERTCLDVPIPRDIAGNLLLRDVAHRLIQSSPERVPVVLTGPNASTEMAYHAGLRTLGTLYWENMPGLKRAARIFSVTEESAALAELTSAGVTHIVVPSWDNFAEAYAKLLARAEGRETTEAPFFKAIVEGDECPDWLRPFAYPIPTDSGLDANSVKIFAVLPQQSPFESLFYRGVYFLEIGQPDKARGLFTEAAALRPEDERPRRYLRQIEVKN